jgi:hypothetical protein
MCARVGRLLGRSGPDAAVTHSLVEGQLIACTAVGAYRVVAMPSARRR